MFQHVLGHGEPAWCPLATGHLWEELLPDWYEEWAAVERERIRQIRLDAQETVCRLMARTGRYCQAVKAGLACIRGDPLRESAHRVLVDKLRSPYRGGQLVRGQAAV
jgi:two-component SAPR family response regulator